MLSSIANWVEDKATGYLRTGIQAGGTLAGNAVGGVGSLVESAGKSAAQGVQGGIGGVGGYINNYGNTIKRSMSADGPVSDTPKKTAVKPSAATEKSQPAQKVIASTAGAKKTLPSPPQKALPSSTGPKKALPASSQKSLPTPKPAAGVQAKTNPTQRPLPSAKPAPNNRVGGPTTVKSQGPVGVSKSAGNATKSTPNVNSSGKVVVSPESRPRPATRKPATNKNIPTPSKDILGIGENFGDISKTRPSGAKAKNSSAPPRKSSAADPLALGDEIGQIGKKK